MQDPIFIDRPVVLSDAEQARYDELESYLVLTLPDGGVIEADNASALAQKLLQFASGAVYDDAKTAHIFHNQKIEELAQIVAESQGQPILVAYWFQSSLYRIKRAFPQAVVMDKDGKAQHAWNRGQIPLMLLHPRSGGHGLNLQEGGHIIVWFDVCYPLELYLQFNARLARQGQKAVVKIFHIVTKGTLDTMIVPRLKRKEASQDYLFDRLKELRRAAMKRKEAARAR